MSTQKPYRIGVIGYGHLGICRGNIDLTNAIGQYICEEIQKIEDYELAFVWNRTASALNGKFPDSLILHDLNNYHQCLADLVVEVAHPNVIIDYGVKLLEYSDLMVGSPTAFADQATYTSMYKAAENHGCYIPSGAFWGAEDIKKMADRGTLQALKVTMTKHPSCFKLNSPLKEKNESVSKKTILFDGSVSSLCPLAPNNVNTMAAAAIAGHNLGFEKVQGAIVADPGMPDYHLVEIDVWGPGDMSNGGAFHVQTARKNPADLSRVTGSATYASFWSSLLAAKNKGPGVHLC